MQYSNAMASWIGSLDKGDGHGEIELDSGAWTGNYGTPEGEGVTDPEELLAGANASCFSMIVSYSLEQAGYSPEVITTDAEVSLQQTEEGFEIPTIELTVDGVVPEISQDEFEEVVESAKQACPVSGALAGTEIEVTLA